MMSRPSTSSSQRTLTLTEELEKLEQSITLTLQEIDHNFSRAHRIVTSSILPVVQRYAEHSKNVWEGSKFWKQFFETSANVSLNGYEEVPGEDDETATEEEEVTGQATPSSSSSNLSTPSRAGDGFESTAGSRYHHGRDARHSPQSLSSPPDTATPRPQRNAPPTPAAYSSPYEALRREVHGTPAAEDAPTSAPPITPRARSYFDDAPQSSPFPQPSAGRQHAPANDVLLHRGVLDKNYRIQATPHAEPELPKHGAMGGRARTPTAGLQARARQQKHDDDDDDDDPDSSPMLEVPQLRSELFGSVARARRTPGVSVLTPAKKGARTGAKDVHERPMTTTTTTRATGWDSDSDDDDDDVDGFLAGMSPPKTMQFHIPQSKLLKTPAREASKRIVEDLLLTAGGGDVTDDAEEDSPSIIRRGGLPADDTF